MVKKSPQKTVYLILILILSFSAAGCDLLLGDPYSLTVEVLDFDENPLEGMKVTTSGGGETGETDSNGKTTLTDLRRTTEIQVIDPDREIAFPPEKVTPEDEGKTITIEAKYIIHLAEVAGTITIQDIEGGNIADPPKYSVDVLDKNPLLPGDAESFGQEKSLLKDKNISYDIEVELLEDKETGEMVTEFFIFARVYTFMEGPIALGMYGAESRSELHDSDGPDKITIQTGDTLEGVDFQLFKVD